MQQSSLTQMLSVIKLSPVFKALVSDNRDRKKYWPAVFFVLALSLGSVGLWPRQALAEVAVEASLSHSTFAQDQGARLILTVTGTNHDVDIDLPQIDNIVLHNQGTSRQFSVVNGTISSSISYNYLVQAEQAGNYSIPPIRVTAEGKSYLTKALNFAVTKAGGQVSGVAGPNDQAGGRLAFLRISETGSHYSGEIVPFRLKAYFTQAYRADINSLPTLRGDGVVMSQLQDKPEQTEESVGGRMYHVLTWDTSLTGIKVGEHPIHFSLDATLLVPRKRQSLSPFGNSLLDDSFFNNSALDNFFGGLERRPIVAVSPEVVFKVLPLPSKDQPNNFTGAIGDFDVKVTATPVHVEVGEPIALTMEISGTGNFDRVEAPVFPESTDWKTYPPTSSFSEQGRSYSGTKKFEQAVVARSGAVTAIPELSFSYFDPEKKKYFTRTSSALAIHVKQPAGVASAQAVKPAVQPQQQSPPQTSAASQAIAGLAPIHLETGSFQERIVPPFQKFWFITVCSISLLSLITLTLLMLRQKRFRNHPEIQLQKRKKQQLEKDLEQVRQAQTAGDDRSFLTSSRQAIQNQLGLLWGIEPTALSLADVRKGLSQDSPLIEIFQTAEQAAYGGATLTEQQMRDYFITLKRELEAFL